jgi:hypothetical protein
VDRPRIVVTDANVLINLIHVDAWAVVAGLPDYEFVVVARRPSFRAKGDC